MNLEQSYQALGLKPGAGLQETRRAYYQLLKRFHPDRYQTNPEQLLNATEQTKKLNLAYERICKVLGGRHARPEKPKRNKSPRPQAPGDPPTLGQPYIIPSSGTKLNWIAAGRFKMGSPPAEAGRSDDEGPQTEVIITRGFWLGTFPVTQEEWKAIAENAADLNAEPSFFRGPRIPVEQVSWDDCQRWLAELNTIERTANRLPPDYQYRLPTEAEWEFACRAGSDTRFHFGNSDSALPLHAWYSENSSGKTHPVGEKNPNAWGLHDIHGNVWEWCHDRYGGPLPGGQVTDPAGPPFGINRVFRGGAWGIAASRCRCAYRVWNKPAYRDYTVGFRLALAPTH